MSKIKSALLYLMAAFYFAAGVNHFRVPDFYLPMMPPYLPWAYYLVLLSGVAEVALAALLLPRLTRRAAAWGVIAMLVVFFSVHVFMIQAWEERFSHIPFWLVVARIPLQFVLIGWAYLFTRENFSLRASR